MSAWKLLVPKFRSPIVVKFKAFFMMANTYQVVLFWIGAGFSFVLIILLMTVIL
jgi:hypothetical protein